VDVIVDMPAQRDAPDYRGYLVPTKVANGAPLSVYTKPDLFSRIEASPAIDKGIVVLFLDEIGQADSLTQKVLTDLILNGRIGEYTLPENVWIIGASNYQEDGAGVSRALTILTNRMTILDVYLPFEDWAKHAARLGIPPVVIDFADFRKDLVFTDAIPSRDGPFPTPRSLTDASRHIMQRKTDQGLDDPMAVPQDSFTKALVSGCVGSSTAIELFAYAENAAVLPKIHEIVADPANAKLPPFDMMSAQYAASQLLIRGATQQNVNAIWKYAERLLKEQQARIANELLKNKFGGTLFNAPDFTRWLAENRSLVTATFER
jgi:hypothetical protein